MDNEQIFQTLRSGRVEGNKYFLPEIQLDRKLYQKCNEVIENLGGKWDRKSKAHIFNKGSDKFKDFLEGEKEEVVESPRKLPQSEKKELQKFYTPIPLVKKMVEMANVKGKRVLEPSAGDGRFILECIAQGASFVQGIDVAPDSEEIRILKEDFLNFKTPKEEDKFDVVIGNPPYSKNQWIKHTIHAYDMLKVGGKLFFILPDSPNRKFYEWIIKKDYDIEKLEKGTFKEMGTMVNTLILTITKS